MKLETARKRVQTTRDQAAIAKGLGDEILAKKISKKAERLEKKLDDKDAILRRLLRDDEEILLLLSA